MCIRDSCHAVSHVRCVIQPFVNPAMKINRNPQLNTNGELIHLLSTEGLSKDILTHILDTAANFVSVSDREVKKVPLLRGKSVFNLFFENSTRTRTTLSLIHI